MNRRSADEIERRICEWERIRDDLGSAARYALVSYVNGEIDTLRHEKLMRGRPLPGGRRTGDPKAVAHAWTPRR